MIGRVVGGVLGAAITRGRKTDPIAGAAIGAATMFIARRFLPARLVVLGGTIAAAVATKHLSDVAERRAAKLGKAASAATASATPSRRSRIAGAPAKAAKRVASAATAPRAPALRRARAAKSPPATP